MNPLDTLTYTSLISPSTTILYPRGFPRSPTEKPMGIDFVRVPGGSLRGETPASRLRLPPRLKRYAFPRKLPRKVTDLASKSYRLGFTNRSRGSLRGETPAQRFTPGRLTRRGNGVSQASPSLSCKFLSPWVSPGNTRRNPRGQIIGVFGEVEEDKERVLRGYL